MTPASDSLVEGIRELVRAIVREEVAVIRQAEKTEEDRYMTPQEAAGYVGCTTRTLKNYEKAGLRVHRARGGKPRYLKSDLDRFLEE